MGPVAAAVALHIFLQKRFAACYDYFLNAADVSISFVIAMAPSLFRSITSCRMFFA